MSLMQWNDAVERSQHTKSKPPGEKPLMKLRKQSRPTYQGFGKGMLKEACNYCGYVHMNGVNVLRMERIVQCVANPIISPKFAKVKENCNVNNLCMPPLMTMMMQTMRTNKCFP